MRSTRHFRPPPIKKFLPTITLAILVLLAASALSADEDKGFFAITGPCGLQFPKDHGPHPGYRTEWWYYTGNLQSMGSKRYGFQLTFFRSQLSPPEIEPNWPHPASSWRTNQVYLAHAALSDINGQRYFYSEEASRAALGMAGALQKPDTTTVFLRNWYAQVSPRQHRLVCRTDDFAFDLLATPLKNPVLHGDAGYSRKGSTAERSSCYYSFTRLKTHGTLQLGEEKMAVTGFSWMDREFSSAGLEPDLAGWDWFSLQLSNETELMVYLLRRKNGTFIEASSGTFVDSGGEAFHLKRTDFRLHVHDHWQSPHSGAVYPSRWQLSVFPHSMDLTISSNLANQEMRAEASIEVTYWEGSVSVEGTVHQQPVRGMGYVELTGYQRPFDAPM
jgi:predicted secreted hydrolase